MSSREWGLVAAGGALLADQISKLILLYGFGFATLAPGERAFSSPVLDIVMAWNPGVSFSFLPAHSPVGVALLVVVAVIGIGALGAWLWRAQRLALAVGLGLVIGGALGNLVDRLVYGRVADFFDIHALGRGFFVCNVADIAISAGVLLLLLDMLVDRGSAPLPREAE